MRDYELNELLYILSEREITRASKVSLSAMLP